MPIHKVPKYENIEDTLTDPRVFTASLRIVFDCDIKKFVASMAKDGERIMSVTDDSLDSLMDELEEKMKEYWGEE